MTTPSSAACIFELLHIYYVGETSNSDVLAAMISNFPQLVRVVENSSCSLTPVLTSKGMKVLVELLATYERLTKC